MAWRCFFLICTGVHTSISHSGERGVGRPDGVLTGVYDCVTGGVLGIAASCGAVSGVSDCEYSFSSHPQMDVSSGRGASSFSVGCGRLEMRPKRSGDRWRPTSARWSARPFPLMPMWDGMCSHLTSSPHRSTSSKIWCGWGGGGSVSWLSHCSRLGRGEFYERVWGGGGVVLQLRQGNVA